VIPLQDRFGPEGG